MFHFWCGTGKILGPWAVQFLDKSYQFEWSLFYTVQVEPYPHSSMGQVSLSDLANKTRRREGGRFKLIQRYLTHGFFEIIFMEFNKKIVDWWRHWVDLNMMMDLAIFNNVLCIMHGSYLWLMGNDESEMSHRSKERLWVILSPPVKSRGFRYFIKELLSIPSFFN